jgi:hypothetical protein
MALLFYHLIQEIKPRCTPRQALKLLCKYLLFEDDIASKAKSRAAELGRYTKID